MEKLKFDSGLRTYRIEGLGTLRFNPADPNLYARFLDAVDQMKALEAELGSAQPQTAGEGVLALMTEADRKLKDILTAVFALDNDFHKLFAGMNLLAVAENGERIVTNLLTALTPVLTEGARRCAGEAVARARAQAEKRRAAQ